MMRKSPGSSVKHEGRFTKSRRRGLHRGRCAEKRRQCLTPWGGREEKPSRQALRVWVPTIRENDRCRAGHRCRNIRGTSSKKVFKSSTGTNGSNHGAGARVKGGDQSGPRPMSVARCRGVGGKEEMKCARGGGRSSGRTKT